MWTSKLRSTFALSSGLKYQPLKNASLLPRQPFGFVRHMSGVKNIDVTVDGMKVSVPSNYTVLQACEVAGVKIPRFCYHDRLSIAGNCRMCLVEVEKAPKPIAACAMPLMPGMSIRTDTPKVKKARQGVLEFLLINHPLDCYICDQGGECDLQDQYMEFGTKIGGRYSEIKRATEDKNLGPLVRTSMNRCIHCTRCVRFSEEVSGIDTLGITGRGNAVEIGTYVEAVYDSELSGNMIDLCPVGALISKPYSFTARPFELLSTQTIDCLDAVGASIRVDTRGVDIMRILPTLNELVNEEWIGDKSRFSYDGLRRQRLDTPLIKDRETGQFVGVKWEDAFKKITGVLSNDVKDKKNIHALIGNLVDAEAIVCLKDFINKLGSDNVECRQNAKGQSPDFRGQYTLNTTIQGIEDADCLLMIGTNPRMEGPLINTRIRKSLLHYGLTVGYIGPKMDLTYESTHLGDRLSSLNINSLENADFWSQFKNAERPMVIVGESVLSNEKDGRFMYKLIDDLKKAVPNLYKNATSTESKGDDEEQEKWNGINFMQRHAARTAGLDLGAVPGNHATDPKKGEVFYLLGADEYDDDYIPDNAFVIYQGHHGDKGARRADVILPGAAYTEKSGTYVNLEGRVQRTSRAQGLVGSAREDWMIIRALSELAGTNIGYESIEDVRDRMSDIAPHFDNVWEVEPTTLLSFGAFKKASGNNVKENVLPQALDNYWMTNAISRNSKVMVRCTKNLPKATNSYL